MFFLNLIILTQFIIISQYIRIHDSLSINLSKIIRSNILHISNFRLKMGRKYSDLNNFDDINNNSNLILPEANASNPGASNLDASNLDASNPDTNLTQINTFINYSKFLKGTIFNNNLNNSNISFSRLDKKYYEGRDMRNISEKYVSLYDIKKNLFKKEILDSLECNNISINHKLQIIDNYNKINNDTDSNLFFSRISSINLKNGGLFNDWNFTTELMDSTLVGLFQASPPEKTVESQE